MTQIETIIVGGGPAGAAAACGLAAAGRDVMLIERTDGPHHKVCGEFLSVETQTQLCALGIDAAALGAVAIDRVSIHSAKHCATAALPFRALSLSRHRLDDALLRRAAQEGALLKRGAAVRGATPEGDGWIVRCDDGAAVRCRRLVLATGKWGLRGIEDARSVASVGLKMHLRPSAQMRAALTGRVELYFLDRGYAGLELIEDGIANLCLLLPRELVVQLGAGWPAIFNHVAAVLPQLGARLAGSEPVWGKPIAVVCPTGGHLHREDGPTIYRVGDRLAHIPPFTGDGLAIALASAALAVEHIRDARPPAQYLAAARRLTGKPIRLASLLSGLAGSGVGRAALMAAAACVPSLVYSVVRRTRLPLPAH